MDPKEVFSFLFNVDAFTLNDDRHFNNIEFIKKNDNTYSAAPIFDNGRGFLNGNISYNKNFSIQENCNRVIAKPFCGDHTKMALYYKDETNFHFMKFKKYLIETGIPKELENNIFAKRIYDVALFRTEEYIKKNICVLPSEVLINYKKENNIIR